ncbi:Ferric reductase, NADH/NADPH oxidase [Handroanthus impetiginosus]|uniref:Ferric reductase, NADH/NADPH oxidase n=1 Tax=Handroanthus impetiginosus TaxID=429701 RepID=A0A2G9I8L7_9LAMI|nr:Ferric reductase, NADH/NADPH oxidase [Handroanthus impetiginosus]
MRTSSFGSSSRYSRSFDLPGDSREPAIYGGVGGAMLPVFLNDLRRNINSDEMVEIPLDFENNSVPPPSAAANCNVNYAAAEETAANSFLARSTSTASRLLRMFSRRRSSTSAKKSMSSEAEDAAALARDMMKMKTKTMRNQSTAQRALGGLRFINKSTSGGYDPNVLWKLVEARFDVFAKDGLLSRQDFADCIGMGDSKEFAMGVFDALERRRRRRRRTGKITKAELFEFWRQISDHSFDARLQLFFDMVDRNGDGKITRHEVKELIMLSASANKLSNLKERAKEYASLIMEELDPYNLQYIELWQLETLLLQGDNYMNYSRPLSTASMGLRENPCTSRPLNMSQKIGSTLKWLLLDNWQRGWILLLWIVAMAGLFTWKFLQYKRRAAFEIMGYCLTMAKGAAETLKLNMALILVPVCRNILTWLRSTRARFFIPFDDNINFHKVIACAIAIGILVHAGNHLSCDFPRIIRSRKENIGLIASEFQTVKPTYGSLLTGVVGLTGIAMVILMMIAYTLAIRTFRRNVVKLPPPFNRLTGFNAFWYSHHLFCLVYILLLIHGTFLFSVHQWYQKTTWMYISVPLLLYIAERSFRTCRSQHYAVKILKVCVLPGEVFSLIVAKPNGFKYNSGQYIYLQCPAIHPFEWHPFSLTSAPGDNYLSVHIRTVGDWTQELKEVLAEDNICHTSQPKLLIDGPYGAPTQECQNYDVLLLVGLGIGATPFISVLRDLLHNTRLQDQTDSNTETSRSDESSNSFTSSSDTSSGKMKSQQRTRSAHFYWVTREAGSLEWFKGVMNEIAEMDHKGQIEMHNYLTSVYEEGDARSTLITMVQALNHAKHGVDILSGTRVRTHFARPDWKEVFNKLASKHPFSTVGVFYCGTPILAKELRKLSQEFTSKSSTRFEFHKEYF